MPKECYEELKELQSRAGRSGSAWNLDELLDMIKSVIESDNNRQTEISAALKNAEDELNKNKNALATAQADNKSIERLENLEKEKIILSERKDDIEEGKLRLSRQKAATHVVYPFYRAWENKKKEVISTTDQIAKKTDGELQARQKAEKAHKDFVKTEEYRSELDSLKNIINKINEEEPKYKQRAKLTAHLADLQKEKIQIDKEDSELRSAEENLKNQIISLKQTITELKERPAELQKAEAEGKKLTDLQNNIKVIFETQITERNIRQNNLITKQQDFKDAFDAYEKISSARIQAERILDSCRAGILAQDLTEGEKCPVCGSTHHPELAKLPDSPVTEKELEKLKKKENDKQQIKNNANVAAEKAKTALLEYEDQMRIAIIDCLENPTLDEKTDGLNLDDLIMRLEKANESLKLKVKENIILQNTISKDCHILKNAEQELENANGEKLESINSAKEILAARKNDTIKSYTESEAILKTLKELSYTDLNAAYEEKKNAERRVKKINDDIDAAFKEKTEADRNLTKLTAEIKTLNDNLITQQNDEKDLKIALSEQLTAQTFESSEEMLGYVVTEKDISLAEQAINSYEQAVSTNETQLTLARSDAAGKKKIDEKSLTDICDEQQKNVELLRKTENTISNRIANNIDKQQKILSQRDELETSRKKYGICRRLYELVRGTTGNGKITLEQYIQSTGFDGILTAANRRLLPMSDGQYELYRKEDSLGKKSNSFLDLEVLDNYTGHKRPVGNLSGGESFKASLSLALGLSDTVSSNLGGIQMDALFVDEGFGTLDRRSIDNAMDILINLSGANKLVGVISHREELIENIPQQIRVKKDKNGSHIEIDTGI